jgi:hypothetical protein
MDLATSSDGIMSDHPPTNMPGAILNLNASCRAVVANTKTMRSSLLSIKMSVLHSPRFVGNSQLIDMRFSMVFHGKK